VTRIPLCARRNRVHARWWWPLLVLLTVAPTVLTGWAGGGLPPAWADANQSAQLQFGGLTRTYTVHTPAGVSHPAGLVVNLHGVGGTGRGQEAVTHYDAVADAHGFVVVYPDGIDNSWADGRGATEADAKGVDDVGFITALVGQLVDQYGIDPGHVFATGMSDGAFMTNRLACDRADVFAAIAPVSGTLGATVPCAPSRPVAVLETHGTADAVIPFDGGLVVGKAGPSTVLAAGAMAARWRGVDGCPGAPAENTLPGVGTGANVHRFATGPCADGTDVVFIQIDGAGHAWPGGTYPNAAIRPGVHPFDVSEASAEFFASHPR
jgi:polyhydroxybutyrate depolymerase